MPEWDKPRDLEWRTFPGAGLGYRHAELSGSVFFMPAIGETNWLYRSRAMLTLPIWDPLTLRFRITEVNDQNPDPGVGNNELTTILGFGLRF